MDYEKRLDRALEHTPDIEGDGERFEVPDPQLRQEGNVTVYENFPETLDRLDREADDVLKFLQSELGTSAGIDESGRARLTGDFKQRRVAEAIDAFVEDFVRCQECGLPDTHLVREKGALVLKCDACGAISTAPER